MGEFSVTFYLPTDFDANFYFTFRINTINVISTYGSHVGVLELIDK